MALTAPITLPTSPAFPAARMIPVAPSNDWSLALTDCSTTDNSGNAVVNPGAVATTGRGLFYPRLTGTTLLLHMKYDDGNTAVTTHPVIQVFGMDGNGVWHRLRDMAGNHEITLSANQTTDLTDGTDCYTNPVEIDLEGSYAVLVTVKTGFLTGTGDETDSSIWVKCASLGKTKDAITRRGRVLHGIKLDTDTTPSAATPIPFGAAGFAHGLVFMSGTSIASVTFTWYASDTPDGTYVPLYDKGPTIAAVTQTLPGGTALAFPFPDACFGAQYLKIKSNADDGEAVSVFLES